jgi:hypothetical protein
MKLSGKFEGKVVLALLAGILQEAKEAGVASQSFPELAVICAGLESEPLFLSIQSFLQ